MLLDIECFSCSVLTLDYEVKVIVVNKSAEADLGLTTAQLTGVELKNVFANPHELDYSQEEITVYRKESQNPTQPWNEGVLKIKQDGNNGFVACLFPIYLPEDPKPSNAILHRVVSASLPVPPRPPSSVGSPSCGSSSGMSGSFPSQLKRVLSSMATPVIVCDRDMRITYANGNSLNTFGFSMEELYGQNVTMLMDAPDAAKHGEYVSRYLTTKQSKIIGKSPRLVKGRNREGDVLNLYLTITDHEDEDGGFTAVFTNVTEQIRQASTLDGILNSMAAPVVMADYRMIITYVNPWALQTFGYESIDELIGQNVKILMPASEAKQHNEYVQTYLESGESKILGKSPRFVNGRTRDGEKLSLYLTLTQQKGGFTAVFTDATRKVRTLTRLDNIFASMATPVITCNSSMLITYANPNALETFGYTQGELDNKNITMLMNNHDARQHDDYVMRYRRTGKSKIIGKVPRLVKGKHRSGLELTLYLTITSDNTGGFTAVFTDVTIEVQQATKLESIFSSMKAPVIISDRDMIITYVNPNALEVFGYDKTDELIGQGIGVLLSDVQSPEVTGNVPRLVVGKHKTGQELSLYLTMVMDEEGGSTAVLTDVTRQTSQASRLENILNSVRSPVVSCNESMQITFVNPNALQVFGYSESELIGRNVTVLMSPSDADKHEGYVRRYESTNKAKIIGQAPRLVEGRDQQGNLLKLYLTITKVPSGGYTAVFSDVTSESRHLTKLASILESMFLPVIIANLDMRITYANPNALTVFGYSIEELQGKNVTILMNAVDAMKHDSYVERYEATAESTIIGKEPRLVLGRNKDGDPLHLYLTITAHEDGYTAVFTNVTAAVRQSQRLEGILSSTASPVLQANERMEIIFVNSKTCQVFGYTEEELLGQNVTIIMNPVDARRHSEYVRKYFTGNKQSEIIGQAARMVEGCHKEGYKLYLYLAITAGKTGGFTAVFTDVTEETRQKQRVLSLFESLPSPVVVADSDMLITYANLSMLNVFGYTKQEVMGKNVKILMNLKDAERHDSYVKNFEETGEARIIGRKPRLVEGRHRDGSKLSLYLTVTKGDPSGYTAVLTDVTKLARQTTHTEAVLTSMKCPVVVCNKRMHISYVNKTTLAVFGYEEEELIGSNVTILMNETDGPRHDGYVRKYLATGKGSIIGQAPRLVQGRHKLGHELHLYLTITTQEVGFTAVFTDVTAKVHGEQRIQRILSSMPSPVVLCDDALMISYVNATTLSVFGYDREDELLKQKVDVLLHPEEVSGEDSFARKFLVSGIPSDGDKSAKVVKGRHRSGATLHLNVVVSAEKVGFTAIFNDVTPLVRQTERLSGVLSSMKSPVVVTNKQMRITYINPDAEEVFGYTEKELMGQNVVVLMNSYDAPRHHEYVSRYEQTEESHIIGKPPRLVQGRHKLGYTLYLYLTITEHEDGYTAVFTDVSTRTRESERIHKILSSMLSPVVVSDADMKITYMNPKGLEIFGYTASEVLGKNVSILMNPAVGQAHNEYVKRYRETGRGNIVGKPARLVEGRTKDGGKLHLYLTVNAEKVGFTAIFTDVTAWIQQTERMQRVLSSMKSPVVISNKKMSIIYANENVTEVFGYSTEELLGHSVNMLMGPIDSDRHDKYVDRYVRHGTSGIIGKNPRLVEGRHKLGYVLHLYLTITEEGDSYTAVFTDVTEEIRTNKRMDRILSSMPSPVVVSNGAMEITYINPSALEVFGYDKAELLGKNVTVLMNPMDAHRHEDYVSSYLSAGVAKIIGGKPRLVEGLHKDGSALHLYLTVTEEKVGFTAIFTDVTALVHERTRLTKVLGTMSSPVVVTNSEMIIQYVNEEALKVFGYESEDMMLGRNVTILMGDTDALRHDMFVARYKKTGYAGIVGKNAHMIVGKTCAGDLLQLYISVTESEDGAFTAVFTDVTEAMKQADRVEQLESMESPVFVTNEDLVIEYVNPCAVHRFNFAEDELVNHPITVILKDVNGQHAKDFFAKYANLRSSSKAASSFSGSALQVQTQFNGPGNKSDQSTPSSCSRNTVQGVDESLSNTLLRAHTKSGKQVLFYFKVTGTETGYTIVLMDVTKQIATTNQLTSLMRSVATCIILADSSMKICYINPFAARTFGYTARELMGRSLSLLSVDLQRLSVESAVDDMLERHIEQDSGCSISDIEKDDAVEGAANLIAVRTKFGNKLLVHASITRTHDRYTYVLQDVTKTHTLVQKLNAMLQATPILMMIYAVVSKENVDDCSITLMSRSCRRMVRTPSSSVDHEATKPTIGKFLVSVFKEHRDAMRGMFKQAMSWKPGVSETLECKLAVSEEGDECSYDVFEVVLTKLEQDEVFVSGRNIESDVALREELRAKLVQGSTSLEKAEADNEHVKLVFGYVAHEFRNMYFGAHFLCEELKDQNAGTSAARDLEQVLRIHTRMGQLFDDVLLMQKIESNEYQYAKAVYNLAPIMEEVVQYASSLKGNDNVLSDVEFSHKVSRRCRKAFVLGSLTHMFQAIANLVSNAFKYNRPGGTISLTVVLEKDFTGAFEAVIGVRDTGIGIPETNLGEVFQPYKRLATGSQRVGTGLGLTFAREFVESGNNGTLSVRPNAEDGVGSVFEIRVPLQSGNIKELEMSSVLSKESLLSDAPILGLVPKQDSSVVTCRDYDVLVVDDDDIVRALLGRRLRKCEWQGRKLRVMEAANGEEALSLVLAERISFAVITLDQDMGVDHYTGCETMKYLREGGYDGTLLGLTGCELEQEKQQMLNEGAEAVLVKAPAVFREVLKILVSRLDMALSDEAHALVTEEEQQGDDGGACGKIVEEEKS